MSRALASGKYSASSTPQPPGRCPECGGTRARGHGGPCQCRRPRALCARSTRLPAPLQGDKAQPSSREVLRAHTHVLERFGPGTWVPSRDLGDPPPAARTLAGQAADSVCSAPDRPLRAAQLGAGWGGGGTGRRSPSPHGFHGAPPGLLGAPHGPHGVLAATEHVTPGRAVLSGSQGVRVARTERSRSPCTPLRPRPPFPSRFSTPISALSDATSGRLDAWTRDKGLKGEQARARSHTRPSGGDRPGGGGDRPGGHRQVNRYAKCCPHGRRRLPLSLKTAATCHHVRDPAHSELRDTRQSHHVHGAMPPAGGARGQGPRSPCFASTGPTGKVLEPAARQRACSAPRSAQASGAPPPRPRYASSP